MQIKNKKYEYQNASKLKACIVLTKWNSEITEKLLEDALGALQESKMNLKDIKIVRVSGAVEMPFALRKMARLKKFDFLVALGCVIRGETPHFDYVCKMAQEGILKVMLEDNIPVGFGILTTNNIKQAKDRIDAGGGAALAALELALLR